MKRLMVTAIVLYTSALGLAYDWSTNPGDGSASNPYQLWTPEQLNSIGNNSELSDKNFKLTADIDMSAYTGTEFQIIPHFRGVFDGDGHIIRNLTYHSATDYIDIALFKVIGDTGTVKNLGLQNISFSGGGDVGGLAVQNMGTVENCFVTGNVAGSDRIGGLIAYSGNYDIFADPGDTYVKNCYARCDIVCRGPGRDAIKYAGGLIGQVKRTRVVSCYAIGDVVDQRTSTGNSLRMGGLIGGNWLSDIKYCSFEGTVTSPGSNTNSYIGGLIGLNGYHSTDYIKYNGGRILQCRASGQVTAQDNVGGLVGCNRGSSIRDCESMCQVQGRDFTGGLVGYNESTDIKYCGATGSVFGNNQVGGLIGYNKTSHIADSFADGSVTGNRNVGGCVGLVSGWVRNCYAAGAVSGTESSTGGLIGFVISGSLTENCYAAVSVSGTATSKGGFIGTNNGTITSCFWDLDLSSVGIGTGLSTGLLGQTTDQLQTLLTFTAAGWDFSNDDGNPAAWKLPENEYPNFLRQPPALSSAYSGGDGSVDNPFQIASVSDFDELTATPGDWSKWFILTADLDLSGTVFNAAPIAPDTDNVNYGFQTIPFSGTFDGNGHTISSLHIEASDTDYVGLFGRITGGCVRNLRLDDVVMNGRTHVGSIAGSTSYGLIDHCQTTGAVSGDEFVGGLAGYNVRGTIASCTGGCSVVGRSSVGGLAGENGHGTITGSKATDTVTLEKVDSYCYGGGLTGCNSGTIENSFSTAAVIADGNDITIGGVTGVNYAGDITAAYSTGSLTADSTSSNYTGGCVGYLAGGTTRYSYSTSPIAATGESGQIGGFIGEAVPAADNTISCFWDIESSGLTYSSGGKAVNTQLMQSLAIFQNAGWSQHKWVIEDGVDSPRLAWEGSPGSAIPPAEKFLAGSGTPRDPYLIYTAEEFAVLSWRADILDKHLKLMNDLDLSGLPVFPIGDLGTFRGIFEGNGHTLSNITIHQPGSDYVGVFSTIAPLQTDYGDIMYGRITGIVRNLRIDNADIQGNDYVGGVVGVSIDGYMIYCSCTGSIDATGEYAGGLAGYTKDLDNTPSIVYYSYANGSVNGVDHVGGLIGCNNRTEMEDCYAASHVTGAHSSVGGLIGQNVTDSIVSSFWDVEASGQANGVGEGSSEGSTGKSTADMMTAATFIEAGWDFAGETANGTKDIWRMCTDGVYYPRLRYEFRSIGDFVCGDGVDLADLEALAMNWLTSKSSSPAFNDTCDANRDNAIDLADFRALSEHWAQ